MKFLAGQWVGLVRDVKPAGEIVREIVQDAARILAERARQAQTSRAATAIDARSTQKWVLSNTRASSVHAQIAVHPEESADMGSGTVFRSTGRERTRSLPNRDLDLGHKDVTVEPPRYLGPSAVSKACIVRGWWAGGDCRSDGPEGRNSSQAVGLFCRTLQPSGGKMPQVGLACA